METSKASGTIEERRHAREEQKRKKEQEILEKIRVNEEELQIEVNNKKMIDDRIKEVKENTVEEYRNMVKAYEKMVKAFEDKHGLTSLKNEQSEIESKIKQCKRNSKKYGGCKHPKYARVDLSGYDNYHCQICGYKQDTGGMSCW